MAKDKEKDKQLLKQGSADDKAITFQRAVFIVCNLKRLIKRPKKDDKQSDSRKRSGHLADCEPDRGRRRRRGTKEPVRRAFTLPSVVCSSVLARLLAPNGAAGERTNNGGVMASGTAIDVGDNHHRQVCGLSSQSRLAPHQLQQPASNDASASPDSLSDCGAPALAGSVPTGSGSFGRAGGLTYLATPVRRLNQSLTGAGGSARVGQQQTERAPREAKEQTTPEQLDQLICPIWAHVMGQLDTLQGRSPDERQLAPASRQKAMQFFMEPEEEPHHHWQHRQQQHQQQVQVRVQVVVGPRRASTDECGTGAAAGSSRRPSNPTKDALESASPSSDVCCYTAPQNPFGSSEGRWHWGSRQALDSLDCQQQRLTSTTSSSKSNNRNKHHHHQLPSTAGTRSPGQQQQPMKRFSSALCLAEHHLAASGAGVQVAGHRPRGDISPDNAQTNLDQQALFSAVEENLVDRARVILERGLVDVNRLSPDKLSCLDMAILQRNLDMALLLQQHGAQESFPQMTREARSNQLYALYCEARRTVEDLTRSVNAFAGHSDPQLPVDTTNSMPDSQHLTSTTPESSTGQQHQAQAQAQAQPQLMLATGSILSSALLEEKHLQLQCWRRRLNLFMLMRYELERLQVPSVPELVILQVVGENSLGLKIVHSLQSTGHNNYNNANNNTMNRIPPGGLTNRIQAPPPGRLNCRRGARCSHWLLGELALWQYPGTLKLGQLPEGAQGATLEGPACDQKLAAFNQLLAQQLEQLQAQDAAGGGQEELPENSSSGSRATGKRAPDTSGAKSGATRRLQTQLSSGPYENSSRLERREAAAALAAVDETSLAYHLMSYAPEVRCQRSLAPASLSQPSIITKYLIEWAVEDEEERGEMGTKAEAEEGEGEEENKSLMQAASDSFRAAGSLIIHNSSCSGGPQQPMLKCRIENLESGRRYRVRVAAGNQAGFSRAQASSPPSLAPSGWRQLDGLRRRHQDDEEIFRKFTKLFLLNKHLLDERHAGPVAATSKSSLINMLMLDATSIPRSTSSSTGTTVCSIINNNNHRQQQHQQHQLKLQRPSVACTSSSSSTMDPARSLHLTATNTSTATPGSVRKNLKNFFQTSSFKFQKLTNQNKRGLYLAAIVFTPATTTTSVSASAHDNNNNIKLAERVVVTNDDRLPVVEISNELVAPAALMSDFYWLLKINGAQWVDIKQLRQQLQRSHSSSNLHLRIKLLSAIEQLQIALNLNDIGHLFYRPIQAHDGSQVICTCKQVSSTKQVNGLSTKWMQLDKILPRHLRKISDSFKRRQSNQPTTKPCPPPKPEVLKATAANTAPFADWAGGAPTFQNQHQVPLLTKRRPTMASNSSNSSLASSGGDGASGQWSQHAASSTVDTRTGGSGQFQNTCNHHYLQTTTGTSTTTTTQRNQTTTNRSTSGRSASLMMTPQTLPVGSGASGGPGNLFIASQQQARHSQPAATCDQTTSTYLMQSSLSIYDLLLYTVQEILQFYFSSRKPLNGGLYLGFLQLQTTVESMRLLVPRAMPNMVPCSRIRDNPHVSREEWALLRGFANPTATTSNGGAPIIVSTARGGSTASTSHLTNHQSGTSNRSSDPSIWSAKDTLGDHLEGDKENGASSQRDRAKSISPGYLLQQHGRKPLSVSSEHLGAGLFLRPSAGPTCAGKGAYSDTELSGGGGGGEESARSQLAFCRQVPPSVSLSGSEVEGGGSQRRNSGASQAPSAGFKTRSGSYVGQFNGDVPEHSFLRLVAATAQRLLAELRSQLPQVVNGADGRLCSVLNALNNQSSNRIYHTELIELNEEVAVILLLPAPENVCPVTSQDKSNYLVDNRDYMFLPLQIFETIHISTYESDLLGKYSRLSTILETDLVVAQHDHRQAFSNNELKSTKSRVSHLQDMVSMADEFWRKLRWIVDVVAFARDKSASQSGGTIRLGTIWRYLELSGPHSGIPLWDGAPLNHQQTRHQHHQHQHQQQQQQWRSSCGCLVELEEPAGAHMRVGGASGSNQHLPELILNDFGQRSSNSPAFQQHTQLPQDTPEDEDEKAIYAYHVSLRDASRAAAARRHAGPQLPASNVSTDEIGSQPVPPSTMVQAADHGKPQQSKVAATPIKSSSGGDAEPHQLSKVGTSSRSSSRELVAGSERLESPKSASLKEVSPTGQVLEGEPVKLLSETAASGSWPGVMPEPAAAETSGLPDREHHAQQHQDSELAAQATGESSISGQSTVVDSRNRWPPKLANDKFARISAVGPTNNRVGPASTTTTTTESPQTSTTNRMAHLRTTNPFLSDSLD